MINCLFGTVFFFKTEKEQGLGSKVVRSEGLLPANSAKGEREWRGMSSLSSSSAAMVVIQTRTSETL